MFADEYNSPANVEDTDHDQPQKAYVSFEHDKTSEQHEKLTTSNSFSRL